PVVHPAGGARRVAGAAGAAYVDLHVLAGTQRERSLRLSTVAARMRRADSRVRVGAALRADDLERRRGDAVRAGERAGADDLVGAARAVGAWNAGRPARPGRVAGRTRDAELGCVRARTGAGGSVVRVTGVADDKAVVAGDGRRHRPRRVAAVP